MFKALILSALVAVAIAAGTLGVATPDASAHHRPALARPDLIIKDWKVLPDARPDIPHNEVKFGRPYKVCYTVMNIGSLPSDPFSVGAGGLGVPFNPTSRHAGLAAGAMSSRCGLFFPTTPPAGFYRLEVAADFFNEVAESNESNNGRVEAIVVLP